MIRIILLLLLIGFFLAVRYLPLWALFSLPPAFVLLLYFFGGKLVQLLFAIPFRMKGRVLKGAEATVNSIRLIPAPTTKRHEDEDQEVQNDEASNNDVDFYELDVVISPKQTKGPFHLWEPNELMLVTHRSKLESDDACRITDIKVINDPELDIRRRKYLGSTELIDKPPTPIERHPERDQNSEENEDGETTNGISTDPQDDDDYEEEGDKFFGPQRLKLNIRVRRGVKKLMFRYYFEKFGSVTIS